MSTCVPVTDSLLAKLGSAIVHADEMCKIGGHRYDRVAFESLLDDEEVRAFLDALGKLAMLPIKRSSE